MANRYVTPSFKASAFNCVHCGAYAHQQWLTLSPGGRPTDERHSIFRSVCQHCEEFTVWVGGHMVYPATLIGAPPSPDMPEAVREIYEEARAVATISDRAAAALLRLAVETLVNELKPGPERLNTKIGQMVKEGLGVEIQRMLDSVRVIGNDTLHSGEIDLEERPETVTLLMFCVNRIVERMITEVRQREELYAMLPPDKLEGIRNRDRNVTPPEN